MKILQLIVSSQVNTLVQPAGPDDQHPQETLRTEAQTLANDTRKPVRLMWHVKRPFETFKPNKK